MSEEDIRIAIIRQVGRLIIKKPKCVGVVAGDGQAVYWRMEENGFRPIGWQGGGSDPHWLERVGGFKLALRGTGATLSCETTTGDCDCGIKVKIVNCSGLEPTWVFLPHRRRELPYCLFE